MRKIGPGKDGGAGTAAPEGEHKRTKEALEAFNQGFITLWRTYRQPLTPGLPAPGPETHAEYLRKLEHLVVDYLARNKLVERRSGRVLDNIWGIEGIRRVICSSDAEEEGSPS